MRDDLIVGHEFPNLRLPEHTGRELTLGGIARAQPLVVCFVRGWWCPKEQVRLRGLVGMQDEIQREYGRIAVVTVDEPYVNGAFRAGLGADFPGIGATRLRTSSALRYARSRAPSSRRSCRRKSGRRAAPRRPTRVSTRP